MLRRLTIAGLLMGFGAGGYGAAVPASDWAKIKAEYHRQRHAFVPAGSGYAARNPGNGWVAEFDGGGFTVRADDGSWVWGLELREISGQAAAKGARARIHGDTLTYERNRHVEEWFVNRMSGLEHGYTVRERLSGGLSFRFAVRGDLRASGAGDSIRLGRRGAAVLTYSGLKAWDADRRPLAARMTGYGSELTLTVDDAGARYPITLDPTVQQAYLKASNTESGDQFGVSTAISGDTILVGAPYESSSATGVNGTQTNNSAFNSGAVYVFTRSGTSWTQQAYLKPSNTGAGDNFGISVALSGDTAVIGAWREDSAAAGVNGNGADNSLLESGAAYVFTRSGTTWSQQAYLKASNPGGSDNFGVSVAVSGDTAIIGANNEDSNSSGINGNQNDNSLSNSGAAYIFARSGSAWFQQVYVKPSNPGQGDSFGISVAISGDTSVVGSTGEDGGATGVNGSQNEAADDSGAAYVFQRSGVLWQQEAYLKASNTGSDDNFGVSVAIDGDMIAVGAELEDSSATGVNGNQASNSAIDSGAAYVFVRAGSTWSQQFYLKASNTGSDDYFGYRVAVSGDAVLVGSDGEDSNGTGVNGVQSNNLSDSSGAAYLFVRNGTTCCQRAYLKASNAGSGDNFGLDLAVSGESAIVTAGREDSNAIGVGGNQTDNSAVSSGAAYVFLLDLLKTSRIGTFTSGEWALDVSGNYFNEGAAPDTNVLFSLGNPAEIPVRGDWNGDGITDVAVYLDGTWLIDANGNGVWDGPSVDKLVYFGGPGFTPYAGDWNGDCKSEIGVHKDGTWLLDFNGNFAWDNTPTDKLFFFGGAGYTPYIGKWGTSANSSIAVHLNGTWLIDLNGNFQWDGSATDGLLFFGGPGYTPVTGDWNGDGRTDLAAYLNGTWIVDFNGNNAWDGTVTDRLVFFGGTGFVPVSGDWNGDGKDKVGGFSAGTWVLDRNGNYAWDGGVTDVVTTYGTTGSVPVPGKWR